MQINSNGYLNANENALNNAKIHQENPYDQQKKEEKENVNIDEILEKSAVEVALSMNAQIVLLSLDAGDKIKNNTEAQKSILDFLSGKNVSEDFNLANIGYEGKPITELSQDEAKELLEGDGFFSIESTSNRVANFVFEFSSDDAEILKQAREGIVKGFEEAKEMWGDDLPEISYQTQARTLELIDAKIEEIETSNEPEEKKAE